jgi:hypothetical protein
VGHWHERRHFGIPINERAACFVDTVELYANAVSSLAAKLAEVDLDAKGLTDFRDYLATYAQSRAFAGVPPDAGADRDDRARHQRH